MALLPITLLIVIGVTLWLSYVYVERKSRQKLQQEAYAELALHSEILSGWLGRFRGLTPIYAHEQSVVEILKQPENPELLKKINGRLERWNAASGAADTYILDERGVAIASSSWNSELSFVGRDFSFRRFFIEALQGRLGRFFAVGVVSQERGYYFAYPVQEDGPVIGVVVVKVPIGLIEEEMRLGRNAVFVTDRNGIVILAGPPQWRLTTSVPLTDLVRAKIERNKQFDTKSLPPIAIDGQITGKGAQGAIAYAIPDRSSAEQDEFLHVSKAMTVENWTVHLLVETAEARGRVSQTIAIVGLVLATLVLAGFAFWQRRRRLMDRIAAREEVQRELERTVADRTIDLRETNNRLEQEVEERALAEKDLRRTQTELIQAGKLAGLGQMSAALSHEFNQPLAAIRTYSDNAKIFLGQGRFDEATDNLSRISRLTDRMAHLSKHLTTFARKPKDTTEPVVLKRAVDETIELLHGRLEKRAVNLIIEVETDICVWGGLTRLQHVIMNLIGNAIDATSEKANPSIRVHTMNSKLTAKLIVDDNGTGLGADAMKQMFDPFFTEKETGKGLGLGLSISYNIVRDFGGTISAENRPEGGARFIVELCRADSIVGTAQ